MPSHQTKRTILSDNSFLKLKKIIAVRKMALAVIVFIRVQVYWGESRIMLPFFLGRCRQGLNSCLYTAANLVFSVC